MIGGMHYSADRGRAFQKGSRVFHPLVCFNCIALHLLPQPMREKTEELRGKLRSWAGGVSGMDLINVNIIGRLISRHVSHCLSQLWGIDRARLIILEFSFSGYSPVSAGCVCVCACVLEVFLHLCMFLVSLVCNCCFLCLNELQPLCNILLYVIFPQSKGWLITEYWVVYMLAHQNMPLGLSTHFIYFDN